MCPLFSAVDSCSFVVISGQHSVEVVRRLREEKLRQNLDLTEPFMSVIARVYKVTTPKHVRQYAAGDAQAAQLTVQSLGLEDAARLFLQGIV